MNPLRRGLEMEAVSLDKLVAVPGVSITIEC